MNVTFYAGQASRTPCGAREGPWESLRELLTQSKPFDGDKGAQAAWSPVKLSKPHRLSANVETVHALVVDFDDGLSIDRARNLLKQWEHYGHTTISHSPAYHKYRVIIPFKTPCRGEDWLPVWLHLVRTLRIPADQKCKDAARLYFLPHHRPGNEHEGWHNPGRWIDLNYDRIIAKDAKKRAKRRIPVYVPASSDAAELRRMFARDESARRKAGQHLGGKEATNSTRHVKCPKCGRDSVWWPHVPEKIVSAMCEHRNSCGWMDSIYVLIAGG